MPRTALIVPVPEAAPYYDRGNGVPAHITILFPFVRSETVDEDAVARFLLGFPAFEFVLDRVERFAETGITWLHPEPSEPFAELTAAVWRRWPDHPPYEGAYDEVIPHLTITTGAAPVPIGARAREVALIEEATDGRWAVRRRFPLEG
jgi:2'-5' RNA ligase